MIAKVIGWFLVACALLDTLVLAPIIVGFGNGDATFLWLVPNVVLGFIGGCLIVMPSQFERQDWVRTKLERCVRLARQFNYDYLETRDKRFRTLRDESMQDARYWKTKVIQ